jgi:hypothetical protein
MITIIRSGKGRSGIWREIAGVLDLKRNPGNDNIERRIGLPEKRTPNNHAGKHI